jgi:hypothetical protein
MLRRTGVTEHVGFVTTFLSRGRTSSGRGGIGVRISISRRQMFSFRDVGNANNSLEALCAVSRPQAEPPSHSKLLRRIAKGGTLKIADHIWGLSHPRSLGRGHRLMQLESWVWDAVCFACFQEIPLCGGLLGSAPARLRNAKETSATRMQKCELAARNGRARARPCWQRMGPPWPDDGPEFRLRYSGNTGGWASWQASALGL